MTKAFISIFHFLKSIYTAIVGFFRSSRMARILLLIVLIKFAIFYGFLKGFLYPRYLKPKWQSEQHRIDAVTEDLLKQHKQQTHD